VRHLLESYFVGVIFWLNLALGALGVAAIHGLSGGRWGANIGDPSAFLRGITAFGMLKRSAL